MQIWVEYLLQFLFLNVFGLTVLYGLFHGLVLLPVLLATIAKHDQTEESQAQGVSEVAADKSSTSEGVSNPDFDQEWNILGVLNFFTTDIYNLQD